MFNKIISSCRRELLICLLLSLATLVSFWQINHCAFINYDDEDYITENSHIQNGIKLEGTRWAFTTTHAANWHPLTWLSHMLDCQLFGLNAGRHHLMNLLFHVANTILLFLILHRMTQGLWQSAFVGALFALHPLHVESVAWVAERKDVLSTLFWMLTMGAYVFYVEKQDFKRYFLVLFFFVLGLMAKPMLVTLPFVLLLLDFWPLRRLQKDISNHELVAKVPAPASSNKLKGKSKKKSMGKRETNAGEPVASQLQWKLIRSLLWEKIPLVTIAILSSTATYMAQQKAGAVVSIEAFQLNERIANAFVSYVVYIRKMIWPNDLAIFYPHPGLLPNWQIISAVFLLISITLAIAWAAKRIPYLAVGWLWYVGTLVPVIGIVQVGAQARADRYTYIPLIGLFIMGAWGIPELLKKWRYRKEVLIASAVIILLCFSMITWTQVGYWQNSITLFDHALKVTDRNTRAYINMASAYNDLGNYRKAIEACDAAIGLDTRFEKAYYNRGTAYSRLVNYKQALADFDKAIALNPKYTKAYNNRGIAHDILGNHKQAIDDFDRAIFLNPMYGEAYYNRGIAYGRLGNYKQALADFDKAIALNPSYREAYYNRAASYYKLGNQRQAFEDLKTAARLGDEDAKNFLRGQDISW